MDSIFTNLTEKEQEWYEEVTKFCKDNVEPLVPDMEKGKIDI